MTEPEPHPDEEAPPGATSPLSYPVVVGTGLTAAIISVAWWSGTDIDRLVMDARAWQGEPWRAFTSVFPHVDFLHLAFNLYWLWVFGTRVEAELGHLATAGIMLLLGVGPALAEYALFSGGVGLSGIGYGLFGMLWALGPRDERFAGIVDSRVTQLFVAWFVLCCVLTAADVWRVGNAAHAAGAILGVLLGLAMGERTRARRLGYAGLLVAATGLCVAGATVGRGVVNVAGQAGADLAALAYREQEKGDHERGAELYSQALRVNDRQPDWWHNLGFAYHRLGRYGEALEAYRREHELRPDDKKVREALVGLTAFVAARGELSGGPEAAVRLYRQALEVDEKRAELWFGLAIAYGELGQAEQAREALERAVALSPENKLYRAALEAAKRKPGGKK